MFRGVVESGMSLSLRRREKARAYPSSAKAAPCLGRKHCPFALVCVFLLAGGGCSFGPRVLEHTHGRYYESVRLVNEEELLRNLIHMRYNEFPLSLNVSSIAAQYELSGTAEARPFFLAPNPSNSNVIFKTFTTILPDLLVNGANRPTITLMPGSEAETIREFLTPIPAETLAFLAETSWPPSTIVRLWIERMNGVPNAVTASGPQRGVISDFARFLRIAELLQIAQDNELAYTHADERFRNLGEPLPAAAVTPAVEVEAAKNSMEYRASEDGKSRVLVRRHRQLVLEVNPGAESSPVVVELMALLNLVPGLRRYDMHVGEVPDPLRYPREPSTTIRVFPRSTAQVYFYLANGVEVPLEHFNCGLVQPQVDAEGNVLDSRELTRGLFEVHVCKGPKHKPPASAYVAVQYRGYWYYIDDADQASKTTMALMIQLSRLDFTRRQKTAGGPFLTLPVGR
ncbi:MAG TPA: hypothetical protein VH575_10840 [Gemmataceae bacterium]